MRGAPRGPGRTAADRDGLGAFRRDHGGVTFVDVRDRSRLVQIVCNPQVSPAAHTQAKELRLEYVVAARGRLERRSPETINPNIPTGEVELVVEELRGC